MNKEKLLELSDTLRGIAEGKEWEYRGIDWFKPLKDPMYYIRQNIQVRLKPQRPQPDPYAELKAAYATGKTIQIFGITNGAILNLNGYLIQFTASNQSRKSCRCPKTMLRLGMSFLWDHIAKHGYPSKIVL